MKITPYILKKPQKAFDKYPAIPKGMKVYAIQNDENLYFRYAYTSALYAAIVVERLKADNRSELVEYNFYSQPKIISSRQAD